MDRDTGSAEKAWRTPARHNHFSTGVPLPKSYLQACIDVVRGDTAKGRRSSKPALPFVEKLVTQSPQTEPRRAQLGLLYAFLGERGRRSEKENERWN